MKAHVEIARLILGLLVVVSATERRTSAVAQETRETVSSTGRTPLKLRVQDWPPQIVVRVHNYAHVDADLLISAEAVATSILREAKVDARWVYCPLSQEELAKYSECAADWGRNAFILNLLTAQMTARIRTQVENLGSAPTPCDDNASSCPINAFYFRVLERAEHFGIQPARLLGHVLAHEVGHLLGAHHSSKGIMRGEWGRDDLKRMGFSILEFLPDQADQLRAALVRRALRHEITQTVE